MITRGDQLGGDQLRGRSQAVTKWMTATPKRRKGHATIFPAKLGIVHYSTEWRNDGR